MIIDIYEVPKDGRAYEGEEPSDSINTEQGGMVRCTTPLHYDLFAHLVTDTLLVDGSLWVKSELQCSHCAESFEVEVREPVFHFDTELDEKTEQVDLTEDMREAIILRFPSYPVCRDDCQGLCPQCGINRNEAACQCSAPEDPRWGALGSL